MILLFIFPSKQKDLIPLQILQILFKNFPLKIKHVFFWMQTFMGGISKVRDETTETSKDYFESFLLYFTTFFLGQLNASMKLFITKNKNKELMAVDCDI